MARSTSEKAPNDAETSPNQRAADRSGGTTTGGPGLDRSNEEYVARPL